MGEKTALRSPLADKDCKPIKTGAKALQGDDLVNLKRELGGDWIIEHGHELAKTYKFEDFLRALSFASILGGISESQSHHPEICIAWGRVDVRIWTHKVDGLSENDFILAAKFDATWNNR